MRRTRGFAGPCLLGLAVLLGVLPRTVANPPAGKQGPPDEQHIRRLIDQLGSPEIAAREQAAKRLVAIGPPAVYALANIGPPAKSAVPQLIAVLRNRAADAEQRFTVAVRLECITTRADEAVPILLDMLQDKSPLLRAGAATGLATFGRHDK